MPDCKFQPAGFFLDLIVSSVWQHGGLGQAPFVRFSQQLNMVAEGGLAERSRTFRLGHLCAGTFRRREGQLQQISVFAFSLNLNKHCKLE